MAKEVDDLPFDREGYARVSEVSQYLGLSSSLIYEMINKEPPDLPHVRFGKNAIRIPRRAVVEFAERQLAGESRGTSASR